MGRRGLHFSLSLIVSELWRHQCTPGREPRSVAASCSCYYSVGSATCAIYMYVCMYVYIYVSMYLCTLNVLVISQWWVSFFHLHVHNTHYNRFMALCPGLPRWAGTRRNIHPLTYPDHHPIFISFFHLLRSIASSLFKLRAWQSFCTTSVHVLFGLPHLHVIKWMSALWVFQDQNWYQHRRRHHFTAIIQVSWCWGFFVAEFYCLHVLAVCSWACTIKLGNCYNSPQQCYLHHLHTLKTDSKTLVLLSRSSKNCRFTKSWDL